MAIDRIDNNRHDHSGFKVYDLYIIPKYDSFQEEIRNYVHFDIQKYKKAKTKTLKYLKTEQIKKLKAGKNVEWANGAIVWTLKNYFLHYDLDEDGIINFGHLLSLVMYTDFTKLSKEFSASFRKLSPFETLKSIKKRNASFFWMSKFLRELVECFGWCSNGDYDEKIDKYGTNQLKGPFFCGMDCKLNIPSFAMRLNSPNSTSKHIEVAFKFSGPKGVVISFDNPSKNSQYQYLRGWDCSWISNFKEEDEVLFFGGFFPIKVVNLRLIKTKENFQQFVGAFWYFDSLLTGSDLYGLQRNKKHLYIIENLINHSLKKQTKASFPPFIMDCFQAFIQNKKQIILNLFQFDQYVDSEICEFLFHSLNVDKEIKRKDDDYRNLIRNEIFFLFPKAKILLIKSASFWSYSFSLMALLNVICQSNLNEIIMESASVTVYDGSSWINEMWNSDCQMLKKKYFEKGFEIAMSKKIEDSFKYNLKIKRITN